MNAQRLTNLTAELEAVIEWGYGPLKRRSTMLTMTEKREIGRYLRNRYEATGGRNVRFADDGAVSIMVDAMPNTNQPGRIFAGWDKDLLIEARRGA